MTRFDYVRPQTVDEAVRFLNEPGLVSQPLAGGTDILVYIRQAKPWFDRLVDISRLEELKIIRQQGTIIYLGAGLTFSEVVESRLLKSWVPFLVEACQNVGSEQIRNLGTLGGNVINAAACADSLPPLVCLDAVAHLRSLAGEREIPLSQLVTGPNRVDRQPGELLTHFHFAVPPEGARSAFIKLGRRNAQSISRLSMAAIGHTTAAGLVDFVRLTPGAATPRTVRFGAVEDMLLNQEPTADRLAQAGQKTAAVMVEMTGRRWSTEYKELAIAALAERALGRVFSHKKE